MLPPAQGVLYADDSVDDRFLLKEAFAAAGIGGRLTELDDGAEVVSYLTRFGEHAGGAPPPGLVIVDLKMPRMTGIEVLRWIRASDAWRCLPVVLLTASNAPGDVETAYDLGANAFLVKPSSATELVDIARALERFWVRHVEFPRCPRACDAGSSAAA